jgi:ATP-dependent RNA helicase DeaD
VAAIVAERLTALLEARLRERDKLQTERSHRFEALARALAESGDELPLITMLLDDSYQQMQHAPVVQPGDEPAAPQPQQKPAGAGHSHNRDRGRSGRRR